ncbi:MAG: permease-like cell division protein FtsX [Rikenellaceae bacterium]
MKEDKRLKRKVRSSYLVSTISISLVLYLVGVVGYLIYTVFGVTNSLEQSITATVELLEEVGEGQREGIRAQIAASPMVGYVEFLSRESKVQDEEFRTLFGENFEDVLTSNPFLDSFEVQLLASSSEPELLAAFVERVEKIEGVESVYYPAMLVERVHATLSIVETVLILFGLTLLFISLILLNNTIRLAVYSRRYIINTMKLVGATRWFIMRPLVWSGVKSGFGAGLFASLLFLFSLYALGRTLPELMTMGDVQLIGIIIGIIILSGVIISLIFTIFAARKFVNMKSNKIYLY